MFEKLYKIKRMRFGFLVLFENTSKMYFKKLYKIKRLRFGFLVFFENTSKMYFKKLNILQKNIQLYKMTHTTS